MFASWPDDFPSFALSQTGNRFHHRVGQYSFNGKLSGG